MRPDIWEQYLDAALLEVQNAVNDELSRQFGQLGDSLRDFLYELFNYPLERPWPDSLAMFAEHWTDRGLKLTPRTLDAIWRLIAEVLEGSIATELAESPESVLVGSSRATDAVLPMTAQSAPREGRTNQTRQDNSSFRFAAMQHARREQDRLGLTDDERGEYAAFVVRSLGAQARGEEPVLPPLFWYTKQQAWLEAQSRQPKIRGITREEYDRSVLRWKYANLDKLPPQEAEKLQRQALLEEKRRYAKKYGWVAAFLNPAFDGTGTLNDWAMVVGGFTSQPPPGLDFRSPRLGTPAKPHRIRRGNAPSRSKIGASGSAAPPSRRRPGKKPPFPRPVSTQRVTIRKGRRTPDPRHVKGAAAEEKAARFIHALPHEAVIMWGQKIGAQGADVVSYNLKTRIVTLWDTKFRSKPVRIRPTKTFEKDSDSLDNALKQAANAVQASELSKQHKKAANESIDMNTFQTRTLGEGQARNSTFGDHR